MEQGNDKRWDGVGLWLASVSMSQNSPRAGAGWRRWNHQELPRAPSSRFPALPLEFDS